MNKIYLFINPLSIYEIFLVSNNQEQIEKTNACFDNLIEKLNNFSQTQKEEVFIFGKNNEYTQRIVDKIKKETNFKIIVLN